MDCSKERNKAASEAASEAAEAVSEAAEAVSEAASKAEEVASQAASQAAEVAEAAEEFFYSSMTKDELQFAVDSQELGEIAQADEVWVANSGDAAPSFQWQVVTADGKVYFIGNSGVAKEVTDLPGINKLAKDDAVASAQAQAEGELQTADLSQGEDGIFYWVVTLNANDVLSMYNVDPEGNVTGPMES
ncbi:MAG: hypothetical protein IJI68_11820 [Eggerthellaceae bacterium]|nr:hypothetical protein [Eggerthellaceae bacterium]